MGRVSSKTIEKLNAFMDSLPIEARNKCSICNDTLTHIVKQAEAQVGVGTMTVAKALADKINNGAAPQDVVSADALRERVRAKTTDRNLSGCNTQIGKTTDKNLLGRHDPIDRSKPTVSICIPQEEVNLAPNSDTDDTPLAREIARVSNGHFATDSDGTRYPIRDPKLRERESKVTKIIFPHLFHPIKNVNACPVKPEEVYEIIPDYCFGQLEGLDEAIEFLLEIKRLHEDNQ